MVLNIPNDIDTLQKQPVNLSSPVSDVFPLDSATKPLEIRKSSPKQSASAPAPASEVEGSETASTRSRSSSNASSIKSYTTTATSVLGDHEEISVTKPLATPSRVRPPTHQSSSISPPISEQSDSDSTTVLSQSSSTGSSSSSSTPKPSRHSSGVPIGFPSLPTVAGPNEKVPEHGSLGDDRRSMSPTASPSSRSSRLSTSSSNSHRSSTSRSSDLPTTYTVSNFDKSKRRPVSLVESNPKSTSTSVADPNDVLLCMIRDNAAAGIWPLDYAPPSPCEAEPPSSARRSDFGDEHTSTTPPPSNEIRPNVELRLAQSNVIPPTPVPKSEIPAKKVRWDTRRYSSGNI